MEKEEGVYLFASLTKKKDCYFLKAILLDKNNDLIPVKLEFLECKEQSRESTLLSYFFDKLFNYQPKSVRVYELHKIDDDTTQGGIASVSFSKDDNEKCDVRVKIKSKIEELTIMGGGEMDLSYGEREKLITE